RYAVKQLHRVTTGFFALDTSITGYVPTRMREAPTGSGPPAASAGTEAAGGPGDGTGTDQDATSSRRRSAHWRECRMASSMLYSAFQPSRSRALAGSTKAPTTSPGRAGASSTWKPRSEEHT